MWGITTGAWYYIFWAVADLLLLEYAIYKERTGYYTKLWTFFVYLYSAQVIVDALFMVLKQIYPTT